MEKELLLKAEGKELVVQKKFREALGCYAAALSHLKADLHELLYLFRSYDDIPFLPLGLYEICLLLYRIV